MDHCLVFCPSTEKMFQTWTAILGKPSFYHVIETVLGWSVKSEISHGAVYEINFWQLGRHNGLFATQISVAVVSCPGGCWRRSCPLPLSLFLCLDVDERGNLTPAKQSTGKQ